MSSLVYQFVLLGFALDFTRSNANSLPRTPSSASRVRHWKEALLIVKPDTPLCWHRQGFRLFWRFKSRNRGGRSRISLETIALIQQMARENSLWGVERIRGELLKLGIQVANLPQAQARGPQSRSALACRSSLPWGASRRQASA
jgi:hypothetical protein